MSLKASSQGCNILSVLLSVTLEIIKYYVNPFSCWTQIYPAFANSEEPDQLASEEASCSGSALFAIKYVNLYEQSGSSNLIGWKLGVAS